jgi:hypothetical protein
MIDEERLFWQGGWHEAGVKKGGKDEGIFGFWILDFGLVKWVFRPIIRPYDTDALSQS